MIIEVYLNGKLEKIDWITYFENIDIEKKPEFNSKIWRGKIGEDYVQNSYTTLLIERMYELKKEIGYLRDSSKLRHIIQLNLQAPQMPDIDHKVMNQAFYECNMYWYEFINEYKEYLNQKTNTDKTKTDKIEINQITAALYFYYMVKKGIYDVTFKEIPPPASIGEIRTFIEHNKFNIKSADKCHALFSEINAKPDKRKKYLDTQPIKGYGYPKHHELLMKLPKIDKCIDLIENDLKYQLPRSLPRK